MAIRCWGVPFQLHGVENENSLREPLYPAHCEAISHEPDTIAVERIKRDGALPLRGMELIDTDTTLMPEKCVRRHVENLRM